MSFSSLCMLDTALPHVGRQTILLYLHYCKEHNVQLKCSVVSSIGKYTTKALLGRFLKFPKVPGGAVLPSFTVLGRVLRASVNKAHFKGVLQSNTSASQP